MKVLVLGADGYLGWPTSMRLSRLGHSVVLVDDFSKRKIELEDGVAPLWALPTLHARVAEWNQLNDADMELRVGTLTNHRFVYDVVSEVKPDVIIHYGEQPSAPYSMQGRSQAEFTQHNNIVGTLNLMFAMKKFVPEAHLIKLGTLGEYGTPNIDIEEGYLTVTHNGRTDTLPFPKQPFSFYHLSKVHDSHNLMFGARVWDLTVTDLNQGVVYGSATTETSLSPGLRTSFHYDAVFGTVINRFIVQAALGLPLTVYGKGAQTRGCLNIEDTLQCVLLAMDNPANSGEFRVFNQFTEFFSINELASKTQRAAESLGDKIEVRHLDNPRVEAAEHYYNPKRDGLTRLGLQPQYLTEDFLASEIAKVKEVVSSVDVNLIHPKIAWKG